MRTDNLNASELKELVKRVTALERATPLNNASIGRNGLRVHSGGVITIQNGGLSITGTAEVIGALLGSGTLTWTGPVSFTGPVDLDGPVTIDGDATINGNTSMTGIITVTGPMNILGDVDITKTLDITGDMRIMGKTTLSDDMTVTGDGKILVGNMKIGDGTHGSGKGVSFTNGGAVAAVGSSVEMYAASGGLVSAGTGQTTVSFNGNGMVADASGAHLSGSVYAQLQVKVGATPNVHVDSNGKLWKTS